MRVSKKTRINLAARILQLDLDTYNRSEKKTVSFELAIWPEKIKVTGIDTDGTPDSTFHFIDLCAKVADITILNLYADYSNNQISINIF